MIEKPEVDEEGRWQSCSVKFTHEARRFAVNYGYKGRNAVQVRFEDGDNVYMSSTVESRYPDSIIATCVPFDVFAKHLPAFIKHLEAVAAEAKETICQRST
jgi:hypothetical protein